MKKNPHILPLIILLFILHSCSIKWTDAIRYGKITQQEFEETVSIETHKRLIFLPVTIQGKEYRFLFDSGAPFSISKQLQEHYGFKIISKGHIVDSDHNRQKVNWAQVEAFKIGNITFTNQTAFIGDFKSNPVLKCLEIDGIIGSNIIRHCNWIIDQQQKNLTLVTHTDKETVKEAIVLPFKTDGQYNLFVDVGLGGARLKNVLVDYGSNGSIALSDEILLLLKDKNIINKTYLEEGVQQSGIVGTPVELNRELVWTDSVHLGNSLMGNVLLQTGKTVSVGNALLSRFRLTIDWNNQKLYLVENKPQQEKNLHTGFKIGYSTTLGVYVQSVIKNSDAYNQGLRPNMKVLKVDDLDFENGAGYCQYVKHQFEGKIFLQVLDSKKQKQDFYIEKAVLE